MKRRRWLGAILVLVVVAGAAYVGQESAPAGARMARAAERFVSGLDEQQKQNALLPFDSPNRSQWFFTPQQDNKRQPTRKGLAFKDMKGPQRQAAIDLLAAGASQVGKEKALDVMSLEAVLRDIEKPGGIVRDPDWYFVTIFGTPGPTGRWGWRLEGHHLSLNFTVENGQVTGATPSFYGANPREVLAGSRKGHQALAKEESLARELVLSLKPEQQKVAIIDEKTPKFEIAEGTPQPSLGDLPKGLAAAEMSEPQKKLLVALLSEYTGKLANDLGGPLMKQVHQAGLDKVHFAWWGGVQPRQPHVYRVQGPTFLLEYVCVQNDGNHIHSCWRNLTGDFGLAAK
jgi:hypothetical protein